MIAVTLTINNNIPNPTANFEIPSSSTRTILPAALKGADENAEQYGIGKFIRLIIDY